MPSLFRFADVEFDARAGELRRGDAVTRLEPQPARVLALLLERPGDVVTRTEIQQAVWSGDTFVDFEHGLNYCIARIRTALGDSATEPRFIETLPRRGYRFVAPVQHEDRSAARASPAADPSLDDALDAFPTEAKKPREALPSTTPPGWPAPGEASPRRPDPPPRVPPAVPPSERPSRWRRTLTAGVAIGFAAVATWMTIARRAEIASPPADDRVRIAVALFDNETDDPTNDRLAQSLTDATVARLALDSTRVAVVGNAAILREPREKRDLPAIGKSLDVGHIVLGQIQNVDGHLRITTHLIRVPDQSHLWARRFEPTGAETLNLDSVVPNAVAEGVAKRLLDGQVR